MDVPTVNLSQLKLGNITNVCQVTVQIIRLFNTKQLERYLNLCVSVHVAIFKLYIIILSIYDTNSSIHIISNEVMFRLMIDSSRFAYIFYMRLLYI